MKITLDYMISALSEPLAVFIACVFDKAFAYALEEPFQDLGNLNFPQKMKHAIEPFTLLGESAIADATIHEVQTQSASFASIVDIYPCTPLQEGLMALSMKQPGNFMPKKIITLPKGVNLEEFQAAWQATINSNAILRTRIFQTKASGLVQAVFNRQKIDWLAANNLADYLEADRQKPMGFGSMLLRYAIINDPTSKVKQFVLTMHHAICDGWSLRLWFGQVDQAYRGSQLSKLVEFNQFISYLLNDDHNVLEYFWRMHLAGNSAVSFPNYPSEKYLPRAENCLERHIKTPDVIKSNVTRSTVIQAAWALLIGRYTNTNDVVFGVLLAGRNVAVPNIQKISGPTVTTVPMRVKIDFRQSALEYLTGIQKQKSEMKPYQHVGLQNIRRLGGATETACEFQNLLLVQPRLDKDPESLFHESEYVSDRLARLNAYGLMLQCDLTHDGFTATASFDIQVVPEEQMQIMLQQFKNVVTKLSSMTSSPIGDIEICDLQEKYAVHTGKPDAEEVNSCVHELIENSSVEHPYASAICSWDGEITYDQLRILSQRLVHRLKMSKIGPEVTVAILFEKSLWAVVAMIAVMKAGGVFVPLDPAHPRQRIESLIREIDADLLLCSEKYYDACTGISDTTIIVSETTVESWPAFDGPACKSISPQNAVYIIFTSGSTGKPKGCVLEHRACCSSMIMQARALGLDSATRVLQFSSYTFDGCILEVLTTLMVGGCVCIPSEEQRLNNIAVAINKMKVNFAFLTPTCTRLISPDSVPELKKLAVGGEKLMQEDVNRWAGKLRLFNVYGPTECCVICVVHEFVGKNSNASIIGQGIIGALVVVKDANQLAPAGTVGELFIGGPNLARGYFKDDEKTAGAFLKTPSWVPSGVDYKLFYKTGDLVKFGLDGKIEYLGRKDTQVKLRGQRIELGEVEHHLRKYLENVVDVVVEVIVPANDNHTQVLTAFICFEDFEDCIQNRKDLQGRKLVAKEPLLSTTIAKLTGELSTSLPQYMIPSIFIPLKAIPLASSGKADRRELRSLVANLSMKELIEYSHQKQEKPALVTEMEKIIQSLWAKTLSIPSDTIGANDSFMRLGGDSILAMKLVAAARDEGILLTVANVFRNPKLSELALVATYIKKVPREDEIEPFVMVKGSEAAQSVLQDAASQCNLAMDSIEDLYPCTSFQEGLVTLSARQAGAYVAQHIFQLSESTRLDLDRFCRTWEAAVESIPILRTRIIQTESGSLMQVVIKETVDWAQDDDLNAYVKKTRETPVGLGTPLTRYGLVTSSKKNDKCYFVWTTHHAIYDGWSLVLILNYLNQAWKLSMIKQSGIMRMQNRTDQLKPFKHFVKKLQDLDRNAAESFWTTRLCNGEPSTFPPFQSTHFSQPNTSLQCNIEFTRSLHSDMTSSTIIRVAWAILIGLYANSSDVVFGETMSGRTGSATNLNGIVGPTITTVPVRILLDPSKSVPDVLREIQSQGLDAIPFEHLGLSNIRRINANVRSKCDFQNLLIIQPRECSKIDESFMGSRQRNVIDMQQPFDTYALTMECQLNSVGLTATAIFDPQVIDARQIKRMMFQFRHVLQQLCLEDKDTKLQDLQTISPEDIQQLSTWNDVLPKMEKSCVHHLIDQVAYTQPCAQAVCSWDGNLSYDELNDISSRLAHNLARLGVHAETKVPMFFNKSMWAVVTIMAIIKAGGAFVPLEPSHSETRIKSIVDQLDCRIILCSPQYADMCSSLFPKIQIITVSASEVAQLPRDKKLHCMEIGHQNALYVIFTSGTTGTPKGVVLEHGAYCSSARDHAKALHFDRSSRHLQFAAYSFDTGVEDVLTTLMVGGCICIPSEDERNYDLAGAMNRMEVNTADLTPSFINQLAPEDVPNLKTLILGGEKLTSDCLKTWADRLCLINGYGATECCVTSLVNSKVDPHTDPANIGLAVGVVCWVVEAANPSRLAPIGCIGELLIEGPTLARGYLNDEKKTETAFLENVRWACGESKLRHPRRLYKTGDLVRYNADGTINYVGRKDAQVKIRGQRVELEEIEHHLINYPRIGNAMAVVPNSGPYEHCLVAVVQLQSPTSISKPNGTDMNSNCIQELGESELKLLGAMQSDLSTYLSDKLPEYMIPTRWIAIESMPLHSSRKLDRPCVKRWLADLAIEHRKWNGLKTEDSSPLVVEELIAIKISDKFASLVSNGSPEIHATVAGYDVKLSAVGIDSIKIMALAAFIKRSYGTCIRVQDLIGNFVTVRHVAQHVLDARAGIYKEPALGLDLLKEFTKLDAQLTIARPIKPPLETVLLTGATGFLGTQILRQLVTRPDVEKVITHVRAPSLEDDRKRIIASAKSATWWSDSFSSKLETWIGDLAQPHIGLGPKQWKQLSNVDVIIHNGASVRWNADYYALEPANVISTLELLIAVAESSRRPKFVYISGGRDFGEDLSESEIAARLAPLDGYSQTKFVSELLVKRFAQRHDGRGHRPIIIKPGLIIGTAKEGISNVDDFLWRFVSASVCIKAYPKPGADAWLWVAGADRVSESVVNELLKNRDEASSLVTISDGLMMQELWDILNEQTGYDVQPLAYTEWFQLIQEDVAVREEAHPLWPVMHLLKSEGNFASKKPATEISTEASGRVRAAIEKNIGFLAAVGFFPRRNGEEITLPVSQGFKRS